jgi:hypothetical protein
VEEVKEVREGKQGEAAGMFDYPFACSDEKQIPPLRGRRAIMRRGRESRHSGRDDSAW